MRKCRMRWRKIVWSFVHPFICPFIRSSIPLTHSVSPSTGQSVFCSLNIRDKHYGHCNDMVAEETFYKRPLMGDHFCLPKNLIILWAVFAFQRRATPKTALATTNNNKWTKKKKQTNNKEQPEIHFTFQRQIEKCTGYFEERK